MTTPLTSVLIVDDEPAVRDLMARALEPICNVSIAVDGADALLQAVDAPPDLIIADFKMPRMNGTELIAGLRKRAPELPIVLISGYVDALGLSEQNTGADAVIQKSANEVVHLVRAVARVLRQPAPKVLLKDYTSIGATLELGVWIEDPEAGTAELVSDLYTDIWRRFKAAGI